MNDAIQESEERLKTRLNEFGRVISSVLLNYKNPAMMVSFGKDSMVMLHMMLALDIRLPIIFHRDPWFAHKYEFAERIIREWGLTVFDWRPLRVQMQLGKAVLAFCNEYQVGPQGQLLGLPKNIQPFDQAPKGTKWLCGRYDILGQPCGTFNYPWDAVFIGHKSSDSDQIMGAVPLKCDVAQNHNAPDFVFPLRTWTDEDIWDYVEQKDVPLQADRYDIDLRQEKPDKTNNSDYWPACTRCIDRRSPDKFVACPKLGGLMVRSIAEEVPYTEFRPDYHA